MVRCNQEAILRGAIVMYIAMKPRINGLYNYWLDGKVITSEEYRAWDAAYNLANPRPNPDYDGAWYHAKYEASPKWTFTPDGTTTYHPYHAMGATGPTLYNTPGKAQRYATKNGYVLVVDLDLLPRHGAEPYEDNEKLAVKFMEKADKARKML